MEGGKQGRDSLALKRHQAWHAPCSVEIVRNAVNR
jgi:hypothetical protein